jgi:hypothetical protein
MILSFPVRQRTVAQTSTDRVALYHARADEDRRKADSFPPGHQSKRVLTEVADTWDRLAELEERAPSLPR